MKKLLLFIQLFITATLPGYSLKMQDVLYVGDLEKAHKLTTSDLLETDLYKKYMRCFAIPYEGKNVYISDIQMDGVIKNDIDLFCVSTPLAYKSELEREFQPELYDSLKKQLKTLREEVKINPPHYSLAGCVYVTDYDMKQGGFGVVENVRLGFPTEDHKTPYQYQFWLDDELTSKIVKRIPKPKGSFVEHSLDQIEFFMPVKNKRVALEVQQEKNRLLNTDKIEFVYEFSIIDEEDKTYFLVTDIYLLYLPTRDIIWSVKRGDLSEEITLE